ncbi:MAG: hypothetical protein ABIW82_17685 [Dokdonella sp.]
MINSRKTEKIVLTIAATTALAAIVLWWYADSSPLPRAPAARVSLTPSMSAAATAPDQTKTVAPPAMPAPSASPTPADDRVSAPTAEPATPPEPALTRAPSSSAVPAEETDGSSGSSPESSAAQSSVTAEPALATVASVEEAGAHDDAIDLFAERIAKLEQTSSSDAADASDARLLNDFNARAPDDEVAARRLKVLRDRLAGWLANFPPERADHMSLVSVECRTAECQILIAEETADVSPQLNESFSASFSALVGEDWCKDLGLVPLSLAMHAAGGGTDGTPDHALWTIYLGDIAAG